MKAGTYRLIATLFITICSCGEVNHGPFTSGSKFSYATAYTTPDGRVTRFDTLSFTVEERDITNYKEGARRIKWENTRHDYYQVRNMEVDEAHVELQLPLNYKGFDNELIAAAGHPTFLPAAKEGSASVEKKEYLPIYSSLGGLTINQRTRYLRDTVIDFDGSALPCKLFEKTNASLVDKLGKYRLVYSYNPTYGFITLNYYYPDNKHISLRLVDVTIKR